MKENKDKQSVNIAGRHYKSEDYQQNDQISSGLATTHEQVSDSYMVEGVNAVGDNRSGQGLEIQGDE